MSTSVRGIGVAVITSMSTASPFLRQRQPLMHAEAMLLVDDGEAEIAEMRHRPGTAHGCRPGDRCRRGEPLEHSVALAAALATGEDRDADAGFGGERRDGGEMLARQDFGRRHQRRLAAAFDDGRGRKQRDHGLARADVALQQAQHALRLGQVGGDVGDGVCLRFRERVGQRIDELLAQRARAALRAAGGFPLMRAHQREGELAGEQFIIGEPRSMPGSPAGYRWARPDDATLSVLPRKLDSARAPATSVPAIPAVPGASAARHRLSCAPDSAESLGQWIDRLDQRQLGEAGFVDDAVGMHHL